MVGRGASGWGSGAGCLGSGVGCLGSEAGLGRGGGGSTTTRTILVSTVFSSLEPEKMLRKIPQITRPPKIQQMASMAVLTG